MFIHTYSAGYARKKQHLYAEAVVHAYTYNVHIHGWSGEGLKLEVET